MKDLSYSAVMGRKNEIIKDAMGVDYRRYEREGIIFDYEAMMADCGYSGIRTGCPPFGMVCQ